VIFGALSWAINGGLAWICDQVLRFGAWEKTNHRRSVANAKQWCDS
jgi:hypothetical protein